MPTFPPIEQFMPLSTLEALPYPAMLYRTDGLLVGYNGAAERFYDVPREPVLNRFNIFETPEILDEAIVRAVKEALEGRVGIVTRANVDIRRSATLSELSQKSVWIESCYLPLLDPEGKVAYALIINRDITELMELRAEAERARAEAAAEREYNESARREIEEQRATILALESPLIEVGDRVLTLPVIGAVTERRAADMMEKALAAVTAVGARYFILDLTGSAQIDTTTANHFSNLLRAVALLGAQGIVVGVGPGLAQTMVSLGLDLSGVRTCRNLREALDRIEHRLP